MPYALRRLTSRRDDRQMSALLHCDRCGRANRADAVFCDGCGARLPQVSAVHDSLQVAASSPSQHASRIGSFIGRQRELAALRTALDQAINGNGQLVMLAGDAGIGKTRIAQELAEEAGGRNVLVLWGRCFEEPGAPPYWPWIQTIRAYLQACDDESLRAALGAGAAYIAGIVPEIAARMGDVAPLARTEDSDQARFQLFDAIAQFLQGAARTRPLLLIFDNLHWADSTSLRLLAFLAFELAENGLMVLGTYRESELSRQHPLTDTLAELTRSPRFQRLQLSGLSREETERFMRCGSAFAPALVAAIHERTEGNPLFLVETVRFLLQEGRLPADASALQKIPAGIREVIGKRLNRLSPPCCHLLTIAACIGREFELELLARLVPESAEDAMLAALDEARAAHVLEALPQADHYQFSHALMRETLYDEILAARRVRLHQRIGEWLEERHRDRREPYLSQLAYHFGEAVPEGVAGKALDYARRAAARAAELLAYEEAVRFYRLALQLQQQHFPQDKERRCQLLLALGAAQNWAGASEPCLDTFLEAATLARELGAPAFFATAALGFEGAGWRLGRPGTQAVALLEEALTLVHGPDERLQADLHAALCRAYIFCDRPVEANAAFGRAVALARRLGEPHGLFKALAAFVPARFWPEQLDERLAAAREALAVAQQAGHPEWTVGELTGWYFGDLMEKGDMATADAVLATHMRVADKMQQPFLQAVGLASQTLLALYQGRFAEAEALAQKTLAVGRRFSPDNAAGAYGLQMFTLRRQQGRLGEVLPLLRHFVQTTPTSATWRPGLALLYAELDMAEAARAEFETLATDEFAAISRGGMWLTGIAYMAEVCAYLKDSIRAATLYRLLRPYAGRNIVAGANTVCCGTADRLLGMLAATLDQWENAQQHFEAAIALDERCGGRPWLADTQYRYAAMLARYKGAGDVERAALLQAGLTTSRELGMAALQSRCLALQDKLEDRLVFPDGLSKREVDVLRFIAAGLSNQAIGERLFISSNTVANHIRSILAKTGTANRTEAAAYAIRHHLTQG